MRSVKLWRQRAPLLVAAALLVGCGKPVELHRGLQEREANEIVAELAEHEIQAAKSFAKEGITIQLDQRDLPRAVRILDARGLPRRSRSSLGEVFRKDGVISSPTEERARYIYALSQELEFTLTQISGVVVARVHVVLPERYAPGEPLQAASAAVFIKHRQGLDPDIVIPRVQQLIAGSLPGMTSADYRKIAVILTPVDITRARTSNTSEVTPARSGATWLPWTTAVGAILFAIALVRSPSLRMVLHPRTWLARMRRRPQTVSKEAT